VVFVAAPVVAPKLVTEVLGIESVEELLKLADDDEGAGIKEWILNPNRSIELLGLVVVSKDDEEESFAEGDEALPQEEEDAGCAWLRVDMVTLRTSIL
jgi:hypothetical protein